MTRHFLNLYICVGALLIFIGIPSYAQSSLDSLSKEQLIALIRAQSQKHVVNISCYCTEHHMANSSDSENSSSAYQRITFSDGTTQENFVVGFGNYFRTEIGKCREFTKTSPQCSLNPQNGPLKGLIQQTNENR